jgi:hypothetical protein
MKTPKEQLIHATKVNRIVRSDMDENDKRKALYELGYHPYNVDTVLKPDWAGRVGILVEPIKRRIK